MTTDGHQRATTRLTSSDRRLAILDNAELVFVRSGFHSTSTREIAEACDVTEPVLYRHFKGKEDLFLSVLARMFDEGLGELDAHPGGHGADQTRLRILEALLLCNTASQIPQAGELAISRKAQLESAFGRSPDKGTGSRLANELGELILERLGFA